VADARRHIEGALAEHWDDPKVFRSILDKDLAGSQWSWKWRIDNQPWWRLIRDGNEWRWATNVPGTGKRGDRIGHDVAPDEVGWSAWQRRRVAAIA
jgi:hypothetical protein